MTQYKIIWTRKIVSGTKSIGPIVEECKKQERQDFIYLIHFTLENDGKNDECLAGPFIKDKSEFRPVYESDNKDDKYFSPVYNGDDSDSVKLYIIGNNGDIENACYASDQHRSDEICNKYAPRDNGRIDCMPKVELQAWFHEHLKTLPYSKIMDAVNDDLEALKQLISFNELDKIRLNRIIDTFSEFDDYLNMLDNIGSLIDTNLKNGILQKIEEKKLKDKTLSELGETLSELGEKINDSENKLQSIQQETERQQALCEKKRDEYDWHVENYVYIQNKYEKLQDAFYKMQQISDAQKIQMGLHFQEENHILQFKIDKLTNEISDLQQKLQMGLHFQEENRILQFKIDKLTNEISDLQQKLNLETITDPLFSKMQEQILRCIEVENRCTWDRLKGICRKLYEGYRDENETQTDNYPEYKLIYPLLRTGKIDWYKDPESQKVYFHKAPKVQPDKLNALEALKIIPSLEDFIKINFDESDLQTLKYKYLRFDKNHFRSLKNGNSAQPGIYSFGCKVYSNRYIRLPNGKLYLIPPVQSEPDYGNFAYSWTEIFKSKKFFRFFQNKKELVCLYFHSIMPVMICRLLLACSPSVLQDGALQKNTGAVALKDIEEDVIKELKRIFGENSVEVIK